MKVFISWSGPRSRHVAVELKEWLPLVINEIEPWFSATDIDAGMVWNDEISKQLSESNVGILCITRESMGSLWQSFEAGALAKAVEKARVIPLLIDLKPTDVTGPLSQFQAVQANKEGIFRLIQSLLRTCSTTHLSEEQLKRVFDGLWPGFEKTLASIPVQKTATQPTRTDRSLIEEVLQTVRDVSTRLSNVRLSVDSGGESGGVSLPDRSATGFTLQLPEGETIGVFSPRMETEDFLNILRRSFPKLSGEYGKDWIIVDSDKANRTLEFGGLIPHLRLMDYGVQLGSKLKIAFL